MARVHDMGARYGDGPLRIDGPDDPVFAQDWHARALALTLACGALGRWNIDMSRHARECLLPGDYARFSYYEKWLAGLADLLVQTGVVTRAELAGEAPAPADPSLTARRLPADRVQAALASGGPCDRDSEIERAFSVGDAVTTRARAANAMVDGGHTRLPAYAQGASGVIVRVHGAHVFPDANAHGLGEAPEPLYSVAFDAAQLFGAAERAGDEVILDLWQSYLAPA